MALYQLDVRDGENLAVDHDGEDHPDLASARASALLSAKDLLAASIKAGRSYSDASRQKIEIRVGASILGIVLFSDI